MQDMLLPAGKMCQDCRHYNLCKFLFDCPATGYECDWSPSRFEEKIKNESTNRVPESNTTDVTASAGDL